MGERENEPLERAIEIAVTAHRHQRQENGLPYVLHSLTLMLKVGPVEGESIGEYIDRISQNPQAVAVKLADLEDNMDITRLPAPLTGRG